MAIRTDELLALKPLAERELARRSLSAFCAHVDGNYVLAPHVLKVCEYLEALERNELKHLIILVPPRHGKTRLVSQLFPAWFMGRHPRSEMILSSNTDDLSIDNSRAFRDVMLSDAYPFATSVRKDAAAVGLWRTTQGGVVRAAGVGGAIQGRGADLLIVDDPVRNAEGAQPEPLEKQWNWFVSDASRRLLPGGHIILSMFRWSDGDLAGRVLEDQEIRGNFTVLSLPAFAEVDDPLGRTEGAVLWEPSVTADGRRVGFDAKTLEEYRTLDSRSFCAQYELRPVPAGGLIFKPEWFGDSQRYDKLPDEHRVVSLGWGTPHVLYNPLHTIQVIDSAWKVNVAADYSVIATWTTDGINAYLVDVWRDRVESPDLRRAVMAQYEKHRPHAVLVEDAGSGIGLLQDFKVTTSLPLIPIRATISKEARAQSVTPYFEAGKVFLPKSAPWLADWINEHLRFPGGRHDDQVDTTSMAILRLFQMAAHRQQTVRTNKALRNWVNRY